MDDVRSRVAVVLEGCLGVPASRVSDGATLSRDLDASSLDRVEILMALEAEFGIDLPTLGAGPAATVADLVAMVASRTRVPV